MKRWMIARLCADIGERLELWWWGICLRRWTRRLALNGAGEDGEPPTWFCGQPSRPQLPPPSLVAAAGAEIGTTDRAFHGWRR